MNDCGGLMIPAGLKYRSGKGFQLVHRCLRCGRESMNIVAEDPTQPDDLEELLKLRPI